MRQNWLYGRPYPLGIFLIYIILRRFAWTRRLRRMMGVHLEYAIMIRGRERISLVVVYRLGLSVALKSMYSSSSDSSSITCLHRLFRCRSIGAFYFEKEIRCDWIS